MKCVRDLQVPSHLQAKTASQRLCIRRPMYNRTALLQRLDCTRPIRIARLTRARSSPNSIQITRSGLWGSTKKKMEFLEVPKQQQVCGLPIFQAPQPRLAAKCPVPASPRRRAGGGCFPAGLPRPYAPTVERSPNGRDHPENSRGVGTVRGPRAGPHLGGKRSPALESGQVPRAHELPQAFCSDAVDFSFSCRHEITKGSAGVRTLNDTALEKAMPAVASSSRSGQRTRKTIS